MSLNAIASHVGFGMVGGFAGKLIDNLSVFNSEQGSYMEGLEVFLQLLADGLFIYNFTEYGLRKGFADSTDPTKGFAFMICFMESQPRLKAKIGRFLTYLESLFETWDATGTLRNLHGEPPLNTNQGSAAPTDGGVAYPNQAGDYGSDY